MLASLKDHTYIGLYAGQPVAMFVLFDKTMDPALRTKVSELTYVYVDKRCRDLGFGQQVVTEAKRIAIASGNTCIMLDTLKPRLDRFYEKQGASVVAEGQLFSHPTEVLAMRI